MCPPWGTLVSLILRPSTDLAATLLQWEAESKPPARIWPSVDGSRPRVSASVGSRLALSNNHLEHHPSSAIKSVTEGGNRSGAAGVNLKESVHEEGPHWYQFPMAAGVTPCILSGRVFAQRTPGSTVSQGQARRHRFSPSTRRGVDTLGGIG